VLPFDGTSGGDDVLANGLAEDILTELSRSRDTRVIARDSSFGLAAERLRPIEIGRRLGVRYVLEGSARRSGDELRINVRLLDTTTGEHVWADRYAAGSSDVYAAQDRIVREITGRLTSEVRESEKAQALRRPPGSLDVYELTMRGLARKHRLDRDSLIAARADLRGALELDPDYAPAQLYLAQVDLVDISSGGVTGKLRADDLPDVLARTRHAVELEPSAPDGYRVLSQVLGGIGDREGALQAALRSVQLAPSNADNLNTLGMAQVGAGQYEEALRSIGTALDLNPSGPPWYQVYKARALYALGRAEESLGAVDACIVQASHWVPCHLVKAAALASLHRQDEARASMATVLTLNPRYDVATVVRLRPFSADPPTAARYLADLQLAGLPGGGPAPESGEIGSERHAAARTMVPPMPAFALARVR
jgi:adenylate cyclase